ncbi:hypothetical protein ACFUJR_36110 [Streptomyces sp. NPDC057271]|uniref:hypothetical protein n=1 Tax=unclassified Streptomyces TaxID=2593676 RepID=UPI003633C0E5
MSSEPAPRREVVTRLPDRSRRTPPVHSVAGAADEPVHDQDAVRVLVRTQLRGALVVVGFLTAFLGPLPLVFRALPGPDTWAGRNMTVWAVLGVAVYPLLHLAARWYVRRAERAERAFHDRTQGAGDHPGSIG